MPIIYPENRQEVVDRVSTDIQAELPESEPFLRNSYIRSLAIGYSGSLYDAYKTIQELQKQMFPDTATGEFADRWAAFKNIYRNPATQSSGYITVTGTAGITIPAFTALQTGNSIAFLTQEDKTIQLQNISILSLTRSGSTVTAITSSNHFFTNGNLVAVNGADQSEYNGIFQVVIPGENSFTYEITGTPATPATGSIIATMTFASILVKSTDYGSKTNFSSGSELFFDSIIPSVDISGFVQFAGLTGGEDLESDDDFKKRYLYAYQHPISYFNVAEITTKCQEINGVTRVFVEEITPDIGQVTIYFMRDNDPDPIPTPAEVLTVKNKLLEIKPAHVDPADIIVAAPVAVPVNFTFSVLDPNTDAMKAAIVANLEAFFSEIPSVSVNVSRNAYISAIYYTIDPASGQYITNFSLSSPTTDIVIADGQIAILGNINWGP